MMMKNKAIKLFSLLLVVIMLASALTVSAEQEKLSNIALDCPYTYDPQPYQDKANSNGYVNVDGKELTDGATNDGGDAGSTIWVGWNSGAPITIVIDLLEVNSGIVRIAAYVEEMTSWGISYPQRITFSASEDGKNYTRLGDGKRVAVEGNRISQIRYTDKDGFSARYIKIEIYRAGGFAFCSEIEVCVGTVGDDDDTSAEDTMGFNDSDYGDPLDKKATSTGKSPDFNSLRTMYNSGEYIETSGGTQYVRGVRPDTSVSAFLATMGHADCRLTDKNGKQKTSGNVVSGDIVTLGKQKAVVIIDGDINCDGDVDVCDYIASRRTDKKTYTPTDIGKKSAASHSSIKQHLQGAKSLYQKYDDPDRSETYPMTVKQTTTSNVDITCKGTSVGTLSISLYKTAWGTWNLGMWKVDGTRVAGGYTDWEYVYRAGTSASSMPFSGGNHGDEDLQSIEFFDASTGEKLNLAVGKSFDTNGVKVVEKTIIRIAGTQTQYLSVTRTYYFIGERITLECECEVLRDTYFGLTYSCMFAVPKTQGRFITFHKTDGSDVSFTSLKVGYADYSGVMYGCTNATSATISGYSGKKVAFDVEVFGVDAHHNFTSKAKTEFWDMNANENKLYFSIFNESGVKVNKGARWSTKASWTVKKQVG